MQNKPAIQEILLRIVLNYCTETPLIIKIINLSIIEFYSDILFLYPIKIILSLEILIYTIKLLVLQTNLLSVEMRTFLLIWRDDFFLKEMIKDKKTAKSQLISHYFGENKKENLTDRGGDKISKLELEFSNPLEIKEIYQKRNGNYCINGEEISKKSLQARLNGLKSRVKNSTNYKELNHKIEFTENCLKEIEQMEEIKKEGLILE